jgi:hypothetical protein
VRLACAIATTALLSTGCGLDFDRFAGGVDGSAADATSSPDASDATSFADASDAASAADASDATPFADASDASDAPNDVAVGDGPVTDGSDAAVCTGGTATCGSTCVASCASCNGGVDFVICMVCADGGPPVLVCGPADPNGFCLNGNYAHCPCQQDTECPPGNQRCTNNQCTACGEPLFNQNHSRCNSNGNCCKTGTNVGQCSC